MVMRVISIESVQNLTFRHNFGSLGPSGKCWHVGPRCGHKRTKIVMLTKTMETIPPLTIKMGALIQEPGFTGKLREKTNWLYPTTLYTGTLLREVFVDNTSTMVNIKLSGYHQLQGIALWLPGRFIRFPTLKLQTNSKIKQWTVSTWDSVNGRRWCGHQRRLCGYRIRDTRNYKRKIIVSNGMQAWWWAELIYLS